MRIILALMVLVSACGGDSEVAPIDASIDAPIASALGTVCTEGEAADCPTDHTCQIRTVIDGSTTEGYCSPPCTDNPDCSANYDGPGTPTCFLEACVIVCTTTCPDGLACLETGGPTKVCAVPAA